jgi:DNA helicase MCM9
MNPRNCTYNVQASLAHNTGLGTPLLSRFDLIFKLVDTADVARDTNVSHYLLNRAILGTGFECANACRGTVRTEKVPWSIEKLRAYIAVVKERFHPGLSDSAATLLERHYAKIRSAQSFAIPITVRFLESLIRLTQAHARLMYRDEATLEDAVAVIRVMECSAYAYGGFDGNVPDIENYLYCDPMEMDINHGETRTDEDDDDNKFFCFEYSILRRYDMLDHMSPSARSKALALQGDQSEDVNYEDISDWRNVGH